MMQYKYIEIVEMINQHKITEVNFEVLNYAHYKNCFIKIIKENISNSNSFYLIKIILTKDGYEDVSFLNKLDEKVKIFNMGKKGKFTLKQIWNDILIKSIK